MARVALAGTVGLAIILVCSGACLGEVISQFPLSDISYQGTGLYASATATVTTGPGYVEVLIRNTSPRQDDFEGSGGSANAFITEVSVNLYGYELLAAGTYVSSTDETWFAQGSGNAALLLGQRELNYSVKGKSDSQGNLVATAANGSNDNVIGSLAALDAQHVPQEDSSAGFLNASPHEDSGAVFDSAVFRFQLDTTETPDENLWGCGTITVKYQGDEYSMRVTNAPEPTSAVLLALGASALLRARGRR